MKKNIMIIILLLFPIYFFECYTQGFRMRNNGGGIKVAVLSFEQDGFMGGQKLGGFAADELTTALYLKNRADVIDRALVRSVTAGKGLSISRMTEEEIRNFGGESGAGYLILGKLSNMKSNIIDPENESDFSLRITFRILNAGDGSVTGIVTRENSGKGELRRIVHSLIYRMADFVRLK